MFTFSAHMVFITDFACSDRGGAWFQRHQLVAGFNVSLRFSDDVGTSHNKRMGKEDDFCDVVPMYE